MPESIRFSRTLLRQQHVHGRRHHARFVALVLTAGEVLVAVLFFRYHDWLGAYTMASYLSKEHLLSKLVRES